MRRVALGIDLDALDLYAGIHGLESCVDDRARALVPGVAATRFGELCDTLGISGTLFVVGQDLANGYGVEEIAALARAGHEIASHSYAHDYGLSRLDDTLIDDDLRLAEEAVEKTCGIRPRGFRAPGYTLSDTLLSVIARRGYLYDSSLLPSPGYYAAKAAVIAWMALRGRSSRSILGPPGQLLRGRAPHRGAHGVVELPVATLPGLRLPYIGTLLSMLPEAAGTLLGLTLAKDPLVVVELHGVDLLDASDGIAPAIVAKQRDLAIPAAEKTRRIENALRNLLDGAESATHEEAAVLFG